MDAPTSTEERNPPRLLLVEGTDDEHVVYALCQKYDLPEVFKVKDKKGVDELLKSISVELKAPGRERLAVILDADQNIDARWEQVRGCASKAGLGELPRKPEPGGTVVPGIDGPRFSIWIMPDNRLPGMIEDFLAFLIPENDPLLPRVDNFLNEITGELRLFPDIHLPKARMHSWLAIQEQPGKPYGLAITTKYLKADSQTVEPFVAWLKRALVD
ncbi:hypothetical protein ES707_09514 [subsurface metagenome]